MSEVEDESSVAIPQPEASVVGRRTQFAAAAAVCLLVVIILGILVQNGAQSLQQVDSGFGKPAKTWSASHPAAVRYLLTIELIFGTVGTAIYMLVVVLVLYFKNHRKAALWSVVVMVGTALSTTAMKLSFRRQRPQWEDSIHTLTSFSFPSGHASGIASGMGVVVVLVVLYVQRKVIRRLAISASVALIVLVGADRILLGVHNASDVVAGYAVAAFWVFTTLALFPPAGTRTPRSSPALPRCDISKIGGEHS